MRPAARKRQDIRRNGRGRRRPSRLVQSLLRYGRPPLRLLPLGAEKGLVQAGLGGRNNALVRGGELAKRTRGLRQGEPRADKDCRLSLLVDRQRRRLAEAPQSLRLRRGALSGRRHLCVSVLLCLEEVDSEQGKDRLRDIPHRHAAAPFVSRKGRGAQARDAFEVL